MSLLSRSLFIVPTSSSLHVHFYCGFISADNKTISNLPSYLLVTGFCVLLQFSLTIENINDRLSLKY